MKKFHICLLEILKCRFMREVCEMEKDKRPIECSQIQYMVFLLYLSTENEQLREELEDWGELEFIFKKLSCAIKGEISLAFEGYLDHVGGGEVKDCETWY